MKELDLYISGLRKKIDQLESERKLMAAGYFREQLSAAVKTKKGMQSVKPKNIVEANDLMSPRPAQERLW